MKCQTNGYITKYAAGVIIIPFARGMLCNLEGAISSQGCAIKVIVTLPAKSGVDVFPFELALTFQGETKEMGIGAKGGGSALANLLPEEKKEKKNV